MTRSDELASASHRFWSDYPIATFGPGGTADESLALIARRNGIYPELVKVVSLDFPGQTVLDFGCGPGHDTIAFLLNGAAHVYAADVSAPALASLANRLRAHGLEDRCTAILIPPDESWTPPIVDHIHAAGVLHHCIDPLSVLRGLKGALAEGAWMWAMVYSAESHFYRVTCKANEILFRQRADGGAPIVNAWTQAEFTEMASEAGLTARYLGGYWHSEPDGPGLSSCWELR